MVKPWDVLPTKDKGDAEGGPLLQSVGSALTEWEYLQGHLTMLFGQIAWAPQYPLYRAFGTQLGVNAKLDMIIFAARAWLTADMDNELLTRIKKFVGEVDSFNQRRNDIAHGIVGNHKRQDQDQEEVILGWYLTPHMMTTKKFDNMQHAYSWTADQVIHYAQHFQRLHVEAQSLTAVVRERSPIPYG